ncbi:MAG: CapA family protein [Eubacteriales bacterium]|nr:CapA family protein [Eubacteriales bacterium]
MDGAKNAGFDMLLTANNHSYDTGIVGYKRTLDVIRERGVETLGTYVSPEETKWHIQDINGIKIGMLCYTWASGVSDDGRPSQRQYGISGGWHLQLLLLWKFTCVL